MLSRRKLALSRRTRDSEVTWCRTWLTRALSRRICIVRSKSRVLTLSRAVRKDFHRACLVCVQMNTRELVFCERSTPFERSSHPRAGTDLVILGNPKVLAKHPLWHYLLVALQRERDCLVEGPLSNLQTIVSCNLAARKWHTADHSAIKWLCSTRTTWPPRPGTV